MKIESVYPKYERFLSDESHFAGSGEGIVFVESVEELQEAISYAGEKNLHITTQGARTGLCGGAVPMGGLIVNLSRMNSVTGFEERNEYSLLRVQAGVTLEIIETQAESRGLFFPPNPTEKTATVGGMFATGASGMSGLRFGAMSRSVVELEWVTPSGDVWNIQRGEHLFNDEVCVLPDGRLLESKIASVRDGTDLIEFLSSNEGRLGIATHFGLLLIPELRESWGVQFFFKFDEQALAFIRMLTDWYKATDELLFAAEFYNKHALDLISMHNGKNDRQAILPDFPQDAHSAIYIELRGNDEISLEEALQILLEMFARAGGADENTWAETGQGIRKFRNLRHTLVEAMSVHASIPDACFFTPEEKSADCLCAYLKQIDESGIQVVLYGHVLEQKMHISLNTPPASERENCIKLLRGYREIAQKYGGNPFFDYGEGKMERPWLDPDIIEERNARDQALRSFFDPYGLLRG